ncbi:Crp/Fnr family transcriptional regulator [Aureivirga sp. CE67]|uniref:Crp/Fnr family transcriptional regulator n=1 Tax=Aureivirga sp. CE67 TaxID=1788983 RepID=UPI0018CB90A6|nr:Crp/Fnr family transcriptional regulator [Aureivirga sp. CE67]
MIRTNKDFLSYIELLDKKHPDFFVLEAHDSGDIILEQDKRYKVLFLIKEGITKCYLSDENGKDFIQEFFGEGMQFGELEVFSNKSSYCSTEAITKVCTYKISHTNYNYLLENDPIFNKHVLKAMAEKIGYKAPRFSFQQSYSIEENLLKLKELYPDFDKLFSKKDIANYLGITIRSLNRTLNNLKESKKK